MNDFQNNLGEPQNNVNQEPNNLNQEVNNVNQIQSNPQSSVNQGPNGLNEMPNNFTQAPSTNFEPKKSTGKGLVKAFIVLIVIVALVAGYFFLTIKKENAKEIFEGSINKQLASMKEVLSEAKSLNALKEALKNKGTVSISAKLNSNIPTLEQIEGNELNFEFGYNKEKGNIAFKAIINDKIGNKLQGELQTDGKIMLIKLDNIFDKVIKSTLDNTINIKEMIDKAFIENETALSSEDLNYILTIFKDGFFESIENEELIEEKVTKKIIEKDLEVKKISYVLNKEN
ncbi:MAG: hypothetical protein GX864_02930, partial [Mollicutes bacterium]|nr:hypothetical protein [Mollicutes bacterium]